MTYYANPKIPENLSGSNESHGRDFLMTGLKVLGIIAALLLALDIAIRLLVPFVPFAWEKKLAPDSLLRLLASTDKDEAAVELELNRLGQKLAAVMDLPPDMTITIHYSSGDTVNAVATLGGNIIVFKGLLEIMESEDALAAVLAHEIAHVKHRDMLKGLGRAFGLMLVSAALGSADTSTGISQGAMELGLLSYSRGQEVQADRAATLALGRLYGHSQGFEDSFQALIKAVDGPARPEMLSSHPDGLKRIERSRKVAAGHSFPAVGPTRPLPPALYPPKKPAPDSPGAAGG